MAEGWKQDHDWSRRYLPAVKMLLGAHLIGEAPVEDDQQRNTDLIVLKLDAVRIACRLRRPRYLTEKTREGVAYTDQLTIRTQRPGDRETELYKIIQGWGNYFFYGFAAPEGDDLAAWVLGDLTVFRGWFNCFMAQNRGLQPGALLANGDASSLFRAFAVDDLPPRFVVARKRYEPPVMTYLDGF